MPLVLLLAAMAVLFLFGNDRTNFYRDGHHDGNSSRTLTLAENLAFQHNLLLFRYQSQDGDGSRSYPETYSRFPLGGFALLKLAILPFGADDYRAKIYAGRLLMLLLFSAAAALAYHSLARITGNSWDALTATLLAFSSYYLLYYADMISNEAAVDLFAVMLAFHGMVVFVQEGRFRQLLVKSGVALLLGWHVYAFLLPFVIFGLIRELLEARRAVSAGAPAGQLPGYGAALLRSRYLMLGAAALLFGLALLSFNFANEYLARDGKSPLRELAAAQFGGGNERFNADDAGNAESLTPSIFMGDQLYRIGQMTLPYTINPHEVQEDFANLTYRDYPLVALGALALGAGLLGLVWVRRQPGMLPLLGTLAVSGLCWALLRGGNVISNDYESVFYIGIPLAVFTFMLMFFRALSPIRLAPAFAVGALAVFVFSSAEMAGIGDSSDQIAVEQAEMADYAAIRELVDDSATVHIQGDPADSEPGVTSRESAYFLTGKSIIYESASGGVSQDTATGDYLMLPVRGEAQALLTPENSHIFLYDWDLYAARYRTDGLGNPIIENAWNVYSDEGRLIYVSDECANASEPFFLHIFPTNAADLHTGREEYGYNNHDFDFQIGRGVRINQTCVVERPAPDYASDAIRTGQYTREGVELWKGEADLP